MRNSQGFLIGKPEGKRLLMRPKCRWKDNINLNIEDIECESRDWIQLALDSSQFWILANTIMSLRVL
jgi:hypothetical protein